MSMWDYPTLNLDTESSKATTFIWHALFIDNLVIHFMLCPAYYYFSKVIMRSLVLQKIILFLRPSRDGPYYVIANGGQEYGRPHRCPHNNFSSIHLIFTKLGHMIPMWKGKNPIYIGVSRSKVKVTVTINRIFDNRVVSAR